MQELEENQEYVEREDEFDLNDIQERVSECVARGGPGGGRGQHEERMRGSHHSGCTAVAQEGRIKTDVRPWQKRVASQRMYCRATRASQRPGQRCTTARPMAADDPQCGWRGLRCPEVTAGWAAQQQMRWVVRLAQHSSRDG